MYTEQAVAAVSLAARPGCCNYSTTPVWGYTWELRRLQGWEWLNTQRCSSSCIDTGYRLLSYKTNSKLHGTLTFISLAQPFVCSYCYSANIDYSNTFQKFWICSNKQSQYFCSGLSWEDCSQVTVTMVSLFSLQIYVACKCLQPFTRHKALLNGSCCKSAAINIIILISKAS